MDPMRVIPNPVPTDLAYMQIQNPVPTDPPTPVPVIRQQLMHQQQQQQPQYIPQQQMMQQQQQQQIPSAVPVVVPVLETGNVVPVDIGTIGETPTQLYQVRFYPMVYG